MKKAILSIVLLAYLAFTSGVMVSFHYCMDKLDSAELFSAGSEKCPKCGMHTGTSKGCCRDEVKIVKMDDDQRSASLVAFVLQPPVLQPVQSAMVDASGPALATLPVHPVPDDPRPPGGDLYLQYRVFRI